MRERWRATCFLAGAALVALDVAQKILGYDDGLYGRPSFLIAAMLLVLGVQLSAVAMLSAILTRSLRHRR